MNFFEKWFGRTRPKPPEDEPVYFHEDDYCQVELLPRENLQRLEAENNAILDFSEEHSDGAGFTDVYVRDAHPVKTADRAIPVADFEQLLTTMGFTVSRQVYTGYSSYREAVPNALGFVLDGSKIFCDHDGGRVQNIWIDEFRGIGESPELDRLVDALMAIGMRWNLVLNDWNLCMAFDLSAAGEIKKYATEY